MDLLEIHNRLNDLINKAQGEYFPPGMLDELLDMGQMALFNDYYIQFQESQRINDALAPFTKPFIFTYATTPGGLITAPADYFDEVSLSTTVQNAAGVTLTRPCPRINLDELPGRLNSRIFPPTLLDPIHVTVQNWNIQLYPKQPMAGTMYYLCRPPIPNMVFTTNSRVINYDQVHSTQMAWADKDITSIIVKALDYIGINTREQDVQQWAGQKDQANILSNLKQ